MSWFRSLFQESLVVPENEVREKDYRKRVVELKQRFRAILFESISMSLFDHHQLAFAFLIAVKVNEMVDGVLAENVDA